MNAHGGPRSGAGRKQTLPYLDRLHVGARAMNFQRRLAERKAVAYYNRASIDAGLRHAQNKALAVLRTEGSQYWLHSFEGDEIRDDVGFSLITLHSLSDSAEPEDAPRVLHLPFSNYGTRERTYCVVSRWASWYFGVNITPRKVRDCWLEYRRFLNET